MNQQLKILLDSKVVQTSGLIAADMDGEKVMMSIEQGKYYGLDAIGSSIWELIAKPVTVQEIVEVLIREYDVSEKQCQKEVNIFLNKMYQEGLISLV